MKTLLNIDYTNDFVHKDGLLTSGEPGQALEAYITSISKEFYENKDFLVFPIDLHDENDPFHPESKLFPHHNEKDTWGRELYGSLEDLYQEIKDEDNVFYMDKTRYSAFAGTNLDIKLRERGIKEVHLVGVCTDICILHTAVDAYNLGYDIVVHEKGVASFNKAGHDFALAHIESCLGGKII